jgi:hypothetical protein
MNPRRDLANVLYREGPIDPEVGVACFTTQSLRIVAMLLHHTCHPVHGCADNCITAGWPGAWCTEMQEAYGREVVPLVLNGCCGNVHHADILNPDHNDDPDLMGRLLAQTSRKVLKTLAYSDDARLDCKSKHIGIPLRDIDPNALAAARRLLEEHPEPIWMNDEHTEIDWTWCYALSLVDVAELKERQPEQDYEIQVFRVGDVAFVALAGEPFVQAQLEIKLRSPARRTYVAHMSNRDVGYIPTREALSRGGYETRAAYWSKLAPDALDMITSETIGLLTEVFH